MEPTVAVGDRVVVHKSAYGLRLPLTSVRLTTAEMPARGDVIVLESPESGIVLLKRVVAVAGDEVTFRGAPTVVPDGKLFVMGDNRASSHDSRAFGFVDARAVLGRAVAVYFRSGELRWIAL